MEDLFCYGVLKEPDVQQMLIGRVVEGRTDALIGYGVTPIVLDGNEYLHAVPEKGARLPGMLLSVYPDELAKMDAYEGDDYVRTRVALESGAEAWAYL